ncbi:hypothetical protein [Natrialba aegyptia]|uniref:Uncharacterized protein n=1 Tax=Natrialba aegyptia DSM 13077 TaxID=1227491 RepID=M0B1H8_9EURY|nr:hypothetical protein [Natrialba aegyptia]ELZ04407.1 hypothetical protein C480_12871 [Natrialba aegyptia DSM 13077]
MSFVQAFDDARAIITLIGLLPAAFIVLAMTRNMTNPGYDMTVAFSAGIELTVHAISPAPVLALLLAVAILLIRAGSGGR